MPFSLKRSILTAAGTIALAGIFAASVQAESFCSTDNCYGVKVENVSSALVKKVRIDQEKTNGACTAVTETFTQNLTGVNITGGTLRGESFTFQANPKCQYKIKFSTTSGCSGDKVAHMKPSNFSTDMDLVQLVGACGTLDTKKYNEFDAYGS